MLSSFKLIINDYTFIKDPESSDLGRRIISGSIDLIHDMGFEHFTFKKLANHIKSTEASIYRYFESKTKLLLYLMDWYWKWLESRLYIETQNITEPKTKLEKSIKIIIEEVEQDQIFGHINEQKLQQVIFNESTKAIFTKEVDEENEHGLYSSYNNIVNNLGNNIMAINPNYQFPHMLISTIIESSQQQRFFAKHLPELTDSNEQGSNLFEFYKHLVFTTIKD